MAQRQSRDRLRSHESLRTSGTANGCSRRRGCGKDLFGRSCFFRDLFAGWCSFGAGYRYLIGNKNESQLYVPEFDIRDELRTVAVPTFTTIVADIAVAVALAPGAAFAPAARLATVKVDAALEEAAPEPLDDALERLVVATLGIFTFKQRGESERQC